MYSQDSIYGRRRDRPEPTRRCSPDWPASCAAPTTGTLPVRRWWWSPTATTSSCSPAAALRAYGEWGGQRSGRDAPPAGRARAQARGRRLLIRRPGGHRKHDANEMTRTK